MNIRIAIASMLFPLLASATVYEGDEYWTIYDNKPAGATIERVFDESKKSEVVAFNGDAKRNAYIIGSRKGTKAWKNQNEKKIKWDMNFKEKFKISIFIETEQGNRTLLYYSHPEDRGLLKEKYIRFGLGNRTIQGNWVTIERNLEKDLKKFNPDNRLIAVNGFKVQGSGKIGRLELLEGEHIPDNPPAILKNRKVYEDAEGGDASKWEVIKVTPSGKIAPEGATVTAIVDNSKDSNVIQFKGEGRKNAYLFGGKIENQPKAWNEKERHIFSWEMKSSEKYRITLYTKTKNGYRSFYITHKDGDGGFKKNKYIYIGMGAKSKSGTWQTFTVDLEKEIKKYEPDNELISINGMKVQGSMEIDNVVLGGKKAFEEELSEKESKKIELFKLALSDKKEPEKGVEVFKQNNIVYIFVSAMSHNYARYFMGLTKVDISDPENIKDLGYDSSILKSYFRQKVLPKEYFNSHEQDILMDFIPVEDKNFNIIFTIKIDDQDPHELTDPLYDALEEGEPFYEEPLENRRDSENYTLFNYKIHLIAADNKELRTIKSYTHKERYSNYDYASASYSSKFNLLKIYKSYEIEGWEMDTIHMSEDFQTFTTVNKISPFDTDDLTRRTVKFLDDNRIVVTYEDDDEGTTVTTYDGNKLPKLVKIEN